MRALEHRADALVEAGTSDPGALVRAGARMAGLTIDVVPAGPAGLPDGEKAWLQPVNRRILLSDACKDGEDTEALAHELAHHHLHDDRTMEDGYEPFGSPRRGGRPGGGRVSGYSSAQVKEVQARVFADEFLCPSDLLRERLRRGETPVGVANADGLPPALVRRQAAVALLRPGRSRSAAFPPRRDRDRAQARCIVWREGPLLVSGGPGTGKTVTLVTRVARLLSRRDVPSSSILVVAGSPRAAEAIGARLAVLRPASVGKTWIGTFDDLAFEVLARWPHAVRKDGVRVLDRVAALRLLAEQMGAARKATVSTAGLVAALRSIDTAYGGPATIEAGERIPANLAEGFEARLADENAVAAGGLVPLAVEMLRLSQFVRENLRRTFRHVLVDDIQDAPIAAIELLDLISPISADVYATGDAGQAIDGFRGREACAVEAFRAAFAPDTITLERNHRSADPVAAAVGLLAVEENRGRPGPTRITAAVSFTEHDDDAAEAAAVADRVAASRRAGTPFGGQAVLAWGHAALRDVSAALHARGIPFLHLGDLKRRREVEDVVSFLAFAVDGDDASFDRVAGLRPYAVPPDVVRLVRQRARTRRLPVRTVLERMDFPVRAEVAAGLRRLGSDAAAMRGGPLTAGLTDWLLAADGPISDLLRGGRAVTERISLAALHHVLAVCDEHERLGGKDAAGLRARIAVAGSLDQRTHYRRVSLDGLGLDAVNLMTIHAARGMEFDVVHVAGLWGKSSGEGGRSDQEADQRVMRVALSRAREQLHMTRPRKRGNRELSDLGCLLPVRGFLTGTDG